MALPRMARRNRPQIIGGGRNRNSPGFVSAAWVRRAYEVSGVRNCRKASIQTDAPPVRRHIAVELNSSVVKWLVKLNREWWQVPALAPRTPRRKELRPPRARACAERRSSAETCGNTVPAWGCPRPVCARAPSARSPPCHTMSVLKSSCANNGKDALNTLETL
eukprot:1119955-Prorocentrum_minimum.AAC.1